MARFKQAQREFIQEADLTDFDPRAKRASQEIAKDPARMHG
ncbi:MAG: hypothetical protein ABSG46_06445 [Candidatus Binataceae bacterium]